MTPAEKAYSANELLVYQAVLAGGVAGAGRREIERATELPTQAVIDALRELAPEVVAPVGHARGRRYVADRFLAEARAVEADKPSRPSRARSQQAPPPAAEPFKVRIRRELLEVADQLEVEAMACRAAASKLT